MFTHVTLGADDGFLRLHGGRDDEGRGQRGNGGNDLHGDVSG